MKKVSTRAIFWCGLCAYAILVHAFILSMFLSHNSVSSLFLTLKQGHEFRVREYTKLSLTTMQNRQEGNSTNSTIYFVGDSLVQGLNTTRLGRSVLNLGIGHAQIPDVSRRIKNYRNLTDAKALVISVGINDLRNHNLEVFKQRYADLIKKTKDIRAVAIHGIFPVDPDTFGFALNNTITSANNYLIELSHTSSNVVYIAPPTAIYKLGTNQLRKDSHLGDGLHLNTLGNELWINSLNQTFTKIMQ